jgi:thiol:disulfide interchange protein
LRRLNNRAATFIRMTGEQLEKAIEERTTPLVVDFYATW